MKPLRAVFDTNIYIAAAADAHGYAARWLFADERDRELVIYTSSAILLELQQKLEDKFFWERSLVNEYISQISAIAKLVVPEIKLDPTILKDQDDIIVLECAVEANAQIIVTADRGLLSIKDYEGIKLVHPSDLKYLFANRLDI